MAARIFNGAHRRILTGFVQRLLNKARNANLEIREAAIRQVLQLQPNLDRATVGAHLDHKARAGLPAWVNTSCWSREIDPILLIGIRNGHQEFESVLRRINLLYPSAP
jgi:hypothetical protein